jgi:hypothetical protein
MDCFFTPGCIPNKYNIANPKEAYAEKKHGYVV